MLMSRFVLACIVNVTVVLVHVFFDAIAIIYYINIAFNNVYVFFLTISNYNNNAFPKCVISECR